MEPLDPDAIVSNHLKSLIVGINARSVMDPPTALREFKAQANGYLSQFLTPPQA
jgi:hypothetical protein